MPRDTDQYDLFVSYARADNRQGWINRFIDELRGEHAKFFPHRQLRYFLDEQDVLSFDDWQLRIHHALAQSRLLVAFLSPAYFASEWCRREWRAWIDTEIAKHILSQGAAPIYFVEVPGFVAKVPGLRQQEVHSEQEVARQVAELCGLTPPHTDFIASAAPIVHQIRSRRQVTKDFVRPFADEGVDVLRREDLRRILGHLARDLDERVQCVRDAAHSETTVPPYNKRFSGRLEELLNLRQRLKDDHAGVVCGVHGLGGIGKTELAFTFAHAFASAYAGGRFFVPCEGKASLRDAVLCLGDFHEIRARIADEERKTPESYFAAVARCLHERLTTKGHVLLVLDNVSDMTLVSPQQTDALTALGPKLHLLATTRLLPPSGGHWLTLGELPENDAMDLLEKHRAFACDTERDAARTIVKRLGGFTLAVELVAAWLVVHRGATYAGVVDGLGLEDLDDTMAGDQDVELRRHNHERRLSAVLGPVLGDLKPAERRAIEYAALLPPDSVALPWLKELVEHNLPEELRPTRLVADPWREVWERLVRLALFIRGEGETTEPRLVRVHRLMQDLVRRELGPEGLLERQRAVDKLVRQRDAAFEHTDRWEDARWELEPFDSVATLWVETGHEGAGWLLNQAATRWHLLAEWTRAEPLMRRALAIDEQSFGAGHPEIAIRLNNLAQLLQATNRLAEAESLMVRAVSIFEKSFGADHPKVATALSNLAQLLQATNRLAEAEPLMRRALAIDEQSFGAGHPEVATGLDNLAKLLQATNRLAEAEPLMRRALAIDEQSFGAEHPNVATALNNLAQLLKAPNRLAEAESLMVRAVSIFEKSFGADHPKVATALSNLAQLLRATNRLAEAESLMRRALAIDEQSFGAEHPNVATALNNLAQLLQATNRLAEAEPLMRRALAIDEQSFGAEHPNVAIRLNNLAQLLKVTNRLAEAEPLGRRMMEILLHFTHTTGHQHPHLQAAITNYAGLLGAMGQSPTQVRARLSEIASPYGISFGG